MTIMDEVISIWQAADDGHIHAFITGDPDLGLMYYLNLLEHMLEIETLPMAKAIIKVLVSCCALRHNNWILFDRRRAMYLLLLDDQVALTEPGYGYRLVPLAEMEAVEVLQPA